jgi:hypothetical protein
MNFLVAY